MRKESITVQLSSSTEEIIHIDILPKSGKDALWEIELIEAKEYSEATVQILEGYSYEYKMPDGYSLDKTNGIIQPSRFNSNRGIISPNIYVGTLSIDVLKDNKKCAQFELEVRSLKTSYREDYRKMLEDITEKCTELLMQQNAPISQSFTTNFNDDAKTLYQRFAFIKSILESDEFNHAVAKILSTPVTNWAEEEVEKDIRNLKRLNSKIIRQLSKGKTKVIVKNKTETVNTPENRFIKFALTHFLNFVGYFIEKIKGKDKLKDEALAVEEKLNHYLAHSIFKEIEILKTIPYNSPILQRKAGYKEIFRTWLRFDLAANLTWEGGNDVYSAGKKDVATLYEYWLFFQLLDLITETFNLSPYKANDVIEKTKDGLGLKLKQGKALSIVGEHKSPTRHLNIKFSYNRTFSGNSRYPNAGSWTIDLRPDYTLSIWPLDVEEDIAEKEELMAHIHFDAKYKIDDPTIGDYKREDLFKIHTYKDAIRRTVGAYVLYPGDHSKEMRGFNELLPGVGAFSIRPSKVNPGVNELKQFLTKLVNHFLNRATQRERASFRTYQIHEDDNTPELHEFVPESYGENRALIPADTTVLIGYYRNEEHLNWILQSQLYNTRIGSVPLNAYLAGAKYLLLYNDKEKITSRFLKLKTEGPKIYSNSDLKRLLYPSKPTQKHYLVFEISNELEPAFKKELTWDIRKLSNYQPKIKGLPFATSLSEVMKALLKQE